MKKVKRWLLGLVLAITMFLSSCATPYTGMSQDDLYYGVPPVVENNSK